MRLNENIGLAKVSKDDQGVVNPTYASAIRDIEKAEKKKEETTKVQETPKHDEKPKNPKMVKGAKKMHLDESFFDDYNDEEEEGVCPECGEPLDYVGSPVIVDTETAYYECDCDGCGKHFKEWHSVQLNFSHYEETGLDESLQEDVMENDVATMTKEEVLQNAETIFNQLQDTNNILISSWRPFDTLEAFGYAHEIRKGNDNHSGEEILRWRNYGSSAEENTLEKFRWVIEEIFDKDKYFVVLPIKEFYAKQEEFYNQERANRQKQLEEDSIPRNARKITATPKLGGTSIQLTKDSNGWSDDKRYYDNKFLRDNHNITVDETDPNYKPNRTKKVAVLQGNYGYGWDDLVEYKPGDPELKADLKSYRENEPQASHRVIYRRVPVLSESGANGAFYGRQDVRDISVEPGYHEWVLKVDGRNYYSFGDITGNIEDTDSANDVTSLADGELDAFVYALEQYFDNGDEESTNFFPDAKEIGDLCGDEVDMVYQGLINAYKYYLGDIAKNESLSVSDSKIEVRDAQGNVTDTFGDEGFRKGLLATDEEIVD